MHFRPTALNKQIPDNVTTLDLSGDKLWRKPGEELVAMMGAIPRTVTTLDLSWNNLWQKTGEELVAMMGAIPRTVTTLDLSGNNLGLKTVADLEVISKCMPWVVNILCNNLPQEQLAALNRYNGCSIKASILVLAKKLPNDLSLEVLSFLSTYTKKDISKVLNEELPPKDVQWLNPYRVGAFFGVGAFFAMASAIAEGILLLTCDITIKSTLMWAGVIGCPIVLGVLAAICFDLLNEPQNKQTDLHTGGIVFDKFNFM